ncbi:hypothetical protein HK101_006218, partial [Irineochytrium annulatum]
MFDWATSDVERIAMGLGPRTDSEDAMVERVMGYAAKLARGSVVGASTLSDGMALSAAVGGLNGASAFGARALDAMSRTRSASAGSRGNSQRILPPETDEYMEGGYTTVATITVVAEQLAAGAAVPEDLATSRPLEVTFDDETPKEFQSAFSVDVKQRSSAGMNRRGSALEPVKHMKYSDRLKYAVPKVPTRPIKIKKEVSDMDRREEKLKAERSEVIIHYLEVRRKEFHDELRDEILSKAEKSRQKRQKLEEIHARLVTDEVAKVERAKP